MPWIDARAATIGAGTHLLDTLRQRGPTHLPLVSDRRRPGTRASHQPSATFVLQWPCLRLLEGGRNLKKRAKTTPTLDPVIPTESPPEPLGNACIRMRHCAELWSLLYPFSHSAAAVRVPSPVGRWSRSRTGYSVWRQGTQCRRASRRSGRRSRIRIR